MSVRDLIDAIASGSATETQTAFNQVMAEKISARLDDMRIEVAQNMFATEEVDLDEEQLDELSKTTLGSYVKKASQSLSKASYDLGDKRAQAAEVDRFTNRHMGDKFRAQGKMKDDLGVGNTAQEKDLTTVLKRNKGIAKASDKLSK